MARNPNNLCVVTIGMDCFTLPMTDGLRLVEIMSGAQPVEPNYSRAPVTYEPRPSFGEVGLKAIRADQLITPRQPAGRTGPLPSTVTKGA